MPFRMPCRALMTVKRVCQSQVPCICLCIHIKTKNLLLLMLTYGKLCGGGTEFITINHVCVTIGITGYQTIRSYGIGGWVGLFSIKSPIFQWRSSSTYHDKGNTLGWSSMLICAFDMVTVLLRRLLLLISSHVVEFNKNHDNDTSTV